MTHAHATDVTEIQYAIGIPATDFLELAQAVWPGTYGLTEVSTALSRTRNIGAWDGARLVGSVRVLTDGYFIATIPEILVHPDYRRRGIGRELMRRALEMAPRGKLFFGAQEDSAEFFERIGCERRLMGFVASLPSPSPSNRHPNGARQPASDWPGR